MVILGLGSNLTDRLAHLRHALHLIQQIPSLTVCQVSPVYVSDALLPDNAPTSWDKPYFNLALRCETSLSPYELLEKTKQIEKQVGRQLEKNWGPRVVDIDLLAWDDLIQYDEKLHIPHEELTERPFALWPLADVAPFWHYPIAGPLQGKTAVELCSRWGSRFDGNAPLHTRQIYHRIDTPELVGILNITPDSFSDGGKHQNENAIIQQLHHLVNTGADVIDIGAEATGPNAKPISAETEWLRLEPALSLILAEKKNLLLSPKISIDTRHPETACKALALEVDWINDVSGLDHPEMQQAVLNSACDIVFMHHMGIPTNKNITLPLDQNPIETLLQWAKTKISALEQTGLSRERLIFDPGIGFGKTAEQSLALLREAQRFHDLGIRVLIGHSRKSFLASITNASTENRDIETAITSLSLAKQHVHYLRVHNTEIHARAFRVAGAAYT